MSRTTLDADALEKQIQADLEIIRRYREVEARHRNRDSSAVLHARSKPPKPKMARRRKRGVAQICESNLGAEWRSATWHWEKVEEIKPKTGRQVVATALRRLCAKGLANKRGDRTSGVEFRRKGKPE